MSIKKTEAIVLRTRPFSETSKIVTLLTPDFGKIVMMAKGARNVKSKFAGHLELFSRIAVIFYERETRDLQYLSDVGMLEPYFAIRNDLSRTYMAITLMEICEAVTHGNEDSAALYQFLTSTLNELNTSARNTQNSLLYFLLHLGDILGFRMDFSTCGHSSSQPMFNYDNGRLVCDQCPPSSSGGFAQPLSREAGAAASQMLRSLGDGISNLTISSDARQEIYTVAMKHLQNHLDELRHLKTVQYLAL